MRGPYQTKQRKWILNYLAEHSDHMISAKEIQLACRENEMAVGLATIYRQLEHLIEMHKVKRIITADNKGARFQYVNENDALTNTFYLKCDACGKLMQMDCGLLNEAALHMDTAHDFRINMTKSILYGRCKSCKQ